MQSDQSKSLKFACRHGIVYTDGSATAPNGQEFSRDEMKSIVAEYKGANRLYKPYFVLMYTDIMNGRHANWMPKR